MLIETPTGYKQIQSILQWTDCPTIQLRLEGKYTTQRLICAPDHLLGTTNQQFIFAKDSLNQTIEGYSESFKVLEIKDVGIFPCYDICVEGGCYYANSILVHNSTISAIFLLHYVLFNSNKTVAILANKESSAKEILLRVKVAYQNLPKFLQQGVTEWNKNSIELENGSRIIASGSSATSIRSTSISVLFIDECLIGETQVTVCCGDTPNIEQHITLEDLYNQLRSIPQNR